MAGQMYGVATYDALFKYILSDSNIRPSFFHAFIPGLPIVSSQRLDEHMNPLQKLQQLRNFLHHKDSEELVEALKETSAHVAMVEKNKLIVHKKATEFIRKILKHYKDIQLAFPKQRYDGTMDFVCKLKHGDYAMVEMQVSPQNYWDRRALAYVAAFYGNQLYRSGDWKEIKKVIGINILGGGKDDARHWGDTPGQYVRHYKLQDQLNEPVQYMDGIELIQYSIMNAPKNASDQEQKDWITFFREGHHMTESDVKKRIKTKAVLQAFDKARLNTLPDDVRQAYIEQDHEFDRYSDHTDQIVQEKQIEIAKKMLKDGLSIEAVVKYTDLTEREVKSLKVRGKK